MAVLVTDDGSLNSFSEVIPKAARHGETYLRAVAQHVQEYEPPVSMRLDEISTGGFRPTVIPNCLVVEPTKPRLRSYLTVHYATPSGGSLKVGWYLVGGDRANGRSLGILGNFGAVTEVEADEVMAIVNTVHTYCVMPAIDEIANLAQFGERPGGFVGV